MSDEFLTSSAAAFYSALIKDLPDVEYYHVSPQDCRENKVTPREAQARGLGEYRKRRPRQDELEVCVFSQTWGSTALGFGGIGGTSMTSAYTTVVWAGRAVAVYFGGNLAYVVRHANQLLFDDMRSWSVAEKGKHYKYEKIADKQDVKPGETV
jgi:hypothetical protein